MTAPPLAGCHPRMFLSGIQFKNGFPLSRERQLLVYYYHMYLKKIIPYLLVIVLGLSGCAALENLDALTALGQYSREKDAQHRMVKCINTHYDALSKAIDQGTISKYKNKTAFLKTFGEPILKADLGNGTQRWLYRYAIYRYAKDKVYVYFDHAGTVVKWEKLPCTKFF